MLSTVSGIHYSSVFCGLFTNQVISKPIRLEHLEVWLSLLGQYDDELILASLDSYFDWF